MHGRQKAQRSALWMAAETKEDTPKVMARLHRGNSSPGKSISLALKPRNALGTRGLVLKPRFLSRWRNGGCLAWKRVAQRAARYDTKSTSVKGPAETPITAKWDDGQWEEYVALNSVGGSLHFLSKPLARWQRGRSVNAGFKIRKNAILAERLKRCKKENGRHYRMERGPDFMSQAPSIFHPLYFRM